MCVPPSGCSAPACLCHRRLSPRISALCDRHRKPPPMIPSPIAAGDSGLAPLPSPIAALLGIAFNAYSARGQKSGPCPARLMQGLGNRSLWCLPGPVVGSARSEPGDAPASPTYSGILLARSVLQDMQRNTKTPNHPHRMPGPAPLCTPFEVQP